MSGNIAAGVNGGNDMMKKQEIINTIKQASELQNLGTYQGKPVIPAWVNPDDPETCLALCCFCSRLHTHGNPKDSELHHKFSHCWSGVYPNGGYYIQLKNEAIPEIILKSNRIWERIWNKRFNFGLLRQHTNSTEILNRVRVSACN